MLVWVLEAWKAYAHRAASYQTHVLLTVVYLLILGPAVLIGRLFGSRLLDLGSGPTSTWLLRADEKEARTLGALRRQF